MIGKTPASNRTAMTQIAVDSAAQEKPSWVSLIGSTPRYANDTFSKWFQSSKALGDDGKPLVLYHGTFNVFSSFCTDEGTTEGAAFFTPDPEIASSFADPDEWGQDIEDVSPNVVPVYLSVQNPMFVESHAVLDKYGDHSFDAMRSVVKRARDCGFDGLCIRSVHDGNSISDQWAAFYPEQIKSAIGNSGEFDPANADIADPKRPTPELNSRNNASEDPAQQNSHQEYEGLEVGL